VLEEAIECNKVVKIFGGQGYEMARFLNASLAQRGNAMKMTVAAGLTTPVVQVLASIALAGVVSITLWQVAHNETTLGSFVSFITAMLMLLAPMKRLTELSGSLQRGLVAAESVFEMVDETPEQDTGGSCRGRARGKLDSENVSFSYHGSDRIALDGVSLSIAPAKWWRWWALGLGQDHLGQPGATVLRAVCGRILLDAMPTFRAMRLAACAPMWPWCRRTWCCSTTPSRPTSPMARSGPARARGSDRAAARRLMPTNSSSPCRRATTP
jgi:subfamily B ATP-binding cassette protein MsbA